MSHDFYVTEDLVAACVDDSKARLETAAASQDARGHLALATARQRLRPAIATTKKLGYYQIECEARLALAEAELRTILRPAVPI